MRAAACVVHFVFLLNHVSGIFGEDASLNYYIDTVIGNVERSGFKIDSVSLPEISKSIPQTSTINLFKSYQMKNGKLDKLETFIRSRNATLNYIGNEADLSAGFSFSDLQVTYDFEVVGTYQFLSLHGSLEGSIQQMNVSFDVTGDTKTLQLRAKSINLDSPGKISLHVVTGTLAQWILNALLDFTTAHFEPEILSAVQKAIMNAINSHLSDVKTQLLSIIK